MVGIIWEQLSKVIIVFAMHDLNVLITLKMADRKQFVIKKNYTGISVQLVPE